MKNVNTRVPGVGDILYLDSAKKMHFLVGSTYDSATFPKGCELVGVLAVRQGNQLLIVNKDHSYQRWSNPFRWTTSGWKLDGLPHEATISFYSSQVQPTNPKFTYTAASLEDVVRDLNAWFDAYFEQSKQKYFAYVEDGVLKIVCETYTAWWHYVLGISGISVDYAVGQEMNANANTYAHNGVGSEYKGMNWPQFYRVVHDATSSTFNPEKPISSLGTYPLSYKSYASEIGAYARGIYGEGEDGYKKYLQDYMIVFPSQRGTFEEQYRDGHKNTYLLAGQTYPSRDGGVGIMYPAADFCAEVGYDHPKLARGQWYLPTMYELAKLYADIPLDYSDPVNKSLAAIGASTLLAFRNVWSSCRRLDGVSWIFDGSGGCSSYGYFYGSCEVVPCALLNANEVSI